ncbi:MAG: helix-turn-helix domain-containing protein [Pseudomonadota bacterium]
MSQLNNPRPVLKRFDDFKWWSVEGPPELIYNKLTDVFDLKALETDLNLGHYRGQSWMIDGLLIAQVETDAMVARRNKWQAKTCAHLVYVHRFLRGAAHGHAGNVVMEKGTNEVVLDDQELRIELVQTPLFVQGLHIPKALIGFDRAVHDPFINFASHSGLNRMLNAEMDQLFTALFQAPDTARLALHRFLASLKLALNGPDTDGDVRRRARKALSDQIAGYIEQHLGAADLCVETLLERFGVSRASLYRMFEERGGVRQYINDRRLYRAVLDISKGPMQRGKIADAAEKWGFSSGANFNRAIRRAFGVAPGSLLKLPDEGVASLSAQTKLSDFVTQSEASTGPIAPAQYLVAP